MLPRASGRYVLDKEVSVKAQTEHFSAGEFDAVDKDAGQTRQRAEGDKALLGMFWRYCGTLAAKGTLSRRQCSAFDGP